MKKLARKFLAMLLTAAIAVSGMVMTTVSAGAKGMFDDAIELETLELVSANLDEIGDSIYYEINLPKKGDITLRLAKGRGVNWCLFNTIGEEISSRGFDGSNSSQTVSDLVKGKYYIKITAHDYYSFSGEKEFYIKDFSYSFSPAQKATVSISATIKKGSTLQLGSVTENYDGKVTWLSTKKSVATVSDKGLVTAKKAGTTYIRAQLDNGDYVEIKVVVKNK